MSTYRYLSFLAVWANIVSTACFFMFAVEEKLHIPVVRIMFRKKATVRFEYFLQDIEKMLSPPCPSTNDETGRLLLRKLKLATSFVDGHCQRFSFSFYVLQKIFKA
ncbi:MAG: hypothetical protein LJE94_15120, partial [Deltaproteobacteria bacterium]|nr:hypothetical protein [Deltaproteobacteria bacterium]